MNFKIALCVVFAVLAIAEARNIFTSTRQRTYNIDDDSTDGIFQTINANRQPHPATRGVLGPQARVFPGAIAIKKLVLLKFKKIVPISLILLKSSNENDAELVPVYPTSEIPANVQFIPTPNGISGHKDVQAIAIPSELHEQLEANGLANIENIEALLNQAAEVQSNDENTVSIVGSMNVDEPLNVSETDVTQLLENVNSKDEPKPAAKPAVADTTIPVAAPAPAAPAAPAVAAAAPTNVRRLAADDISRPFSHGVRAAQQTTVEEIPLFLYSAKDAPKLHNNARIAGLRLATSNGAVRRQFIA